MGTDTSEPLEEVDPESVTVDAVDADDVRAALDSTNPTVQRRGLRVCETLAGEDVSAVEPFLDDVSALVNRDTAATSLRAIAVLNTVAGVEPEALDGRLEALAEAAGSELTDVQLTGAQVLGKVVVDHPDIVAPYVKALLEGIQSTKLDPDPPEVPDAVEHRQTAETLYEHENDERQRRMSGRQTLINVVVAVAEQKPAAVSDAVDDLVALFDDSDPAIAGGALDALGELAKTDPEAVAPVRDDIVECLDHDRPLVRARAIRALGRLGDDAAVPELRSMAESDDDKNVRDIAAETADFLEV